MWANQPVWCKALSRLVLKRFATFLGNVFVNRPLWCKALSRLVLVLQQLRLPPKSDKLPPEKKIIPKLDISQTFRTLKKDGANLSPRESCGTFAAPAESLLPYASPMSLQAA